MNKKILLLGALTLCVTTVSLAMNTRYYTTPDPQTLTDTHCEDPFTAILSLQAERRKLKNPQKKIEKIDPRKKQGNSQKLLNLKKTARDDTVKNGDADNNTCSLKTTKLATISRLFYGGVKLLVKPLILATVIYSVAAASSSQESILKIPPGDDDLFKTKLTELLCHIVVACSEEGLCVLTGQCPCGSYPFAPQWWFEKYDQQYR